MGDGAPRYARLADATAITPHLVVTGRQAEVAELRAALVARFGALSVTEPEPPRFARCFATFSTAAAAAAAAAAVQGGALGASLVARHVGARPPPKPAGAAEDAPQPAVATAEECGVPGLALLPAFVTAEEEAALLRLVDGRPWESLARRRVQHFGRPFNYVTRSVDPAAPADPFPEELLPLVERLQALPGVGPLDQLTVNEYPPGVGLSPHVDTHSAFGDAIVSLSLAGPAAMALRRGGARRALLLPPRSALVLAGEARHAWDHYIPHRKADPLAGGGASPRGPRRVSLTFRRVRRGPCACAWPEHCDSQLGSIPPTRAALGLAAAARGGGGGGGEREAAAPAERLRLEEDNVLAVYDAIAGHFSATRFSVWPAVRRFLDALPPGALVADVGCGNGKYFGVRRDIFVSGSDRSGGLAAVAARRLLPAGASAPPPLADVAVADALRLPYRPAACDAALCIAVLHHLSTPRRRVALLEQLAAALAPGGRALVTVWATEQADMGKVARWQAVGGGRGGAGAEEGAGAERPSAGPLEPPSHDYLVPWHLPLHRADAAAAAAAAAAAPSLDAGKASLVFRRYYHLFGAGELEGLVGQVPGCAVVESFYDKDNWVVVFERAAGGGAAWAWDGMRTRG